MMEFIVSTTGLNVTLEDIGVTLTHPETRDLKDDEYGLADLLDSQDLEAALRAGTLVAQDEFARPIPSVAISEWYERIATNATGLLDKLESGDNVSELVNDAGYVTTADAVDVSTGVPDAGKITKLDAAGQLDGSMINEANEEFTIKGATSTFDVRFRAQAAPFGGFTIDKPNTASGFMSWMPNATTVQWIMGDPTAGAGVNSMFWDVDNVGELFINTLPGAGRGANVFISHSAALLPGADLVSDLGSLALRWTNVYGQEFIGGGSNLTGITPAQIGLNNTDDLPQGSTNLYFPEAPIDNNPYVRQDGGWVLSPSGGGVSLNAIWKYNSSTSPSPSSGEFRLNNSNPNSATLLYLSDETEAGFDFSNLITKIGIGDIIYVQNSEDGNENAIFEVTSTTDSGSFYTFGVTVLQAGSTSFDDGKEFGILFALGVSGGGSSPWIPTGVSDIKYEAGNVGIGGDPDAACQLHLIDDTGKDLCVEQVGTAGSAFIALRKARGTIGSLSPLLSGDKIAGFDGSGWDGSAYESTAEVAYYATENYSGTGRGSELRLEVTENGTTLRVPKWTVRNDGVKDSHNEKIVNLGDPTLENDAVPYKLLDAVKVRSTATGNLNTGVATFNNFKTVDQLGSTLGQFTFATNGITPLFTGAVRIDFNIELFSTSTRTTVGFRWSHNGSVGTWTRHSYIRDSSGHNESSANFSTIIPVVAGQPIQIQHDNFAGGGTTTSPEDGVEFTVQRIK